jgi:arabinose-5-phosphate isomerase
MKESLIADRAAEFIKDTRFVLENLKVDIQALSCAIDAVSNCKGKIVTTGLGKAGYAARKASSSFCSLGIPAIFLHPAEASHGDSGVLGTSDVVLAFSTSGKTREVIETLIFAREKVAHVIAITSHQDATVKGHADIVLDMGAIIEAGYLHMAPTTSIVVMLIVADMLATMSAEDRGYTVQKFAKCHHGGYLGAKARGEDVSSSSSF